MESFIWNVFSDEIGKKKNVKLIYSIIDFYKYICCLNNYILLYKPAGCGGEYSAPADQLTSPNFPNNYSHNQSCVYQITQPPGATITLTFDVFAVEGPDRDGQCQYDYLQVRLRKH